MERDRYSMIKDQDIEILLGSLHLQRRVQHFIRQLGIQIILVLNSNQIGLIKLLINRTRSKASIISANSCNIIWCPSIQKILPLLIKLIFMIIMYHLQLKQE